MKKRILSVFLALALCLTLLPTAAFADEGTSSEPTTPIVKSGTWTNKSDDTGNVYGTGTWNLDADGTLTVLGNDNTVANVSNNITTGIYKNGSVQNGSAVTTVTGATNATITTTKGDTDNSVKTAVVYKYGADIEITVTSTSSYSISGSGSSTTTIVDTTNVAVTVSAPGYAVYEGSSSGGGGVKSFFVKTVTSDSGGSTSIVATVTATVTAVADGKLVTIKIGDTPQFTVKTTAVGSDDGEGEYYVHVTTELKDASGDLIARTETQVYTSGDQAGMIGRTETTADSKTITIPSTGELPDCGNVEELPWYEDRDSVKKVVVGAGITAIGVCNFCDCENLTAVVLPAGLKKIGGSAFSNCTSLAGLDIPDSVTEISSGAFSGCTSLTAINVETGNVNYKFDNGVLFEKNDDGTNTWTLHTYLCGNTTNEYTVPDDVTAIADSAFMSAAHLTVLNLPVSLKKIDTRYCGLDFCEKLINIEVDPDNTTYKSIDGVLFKINDSASGAGGAAITTESGTAGQMLTLLFYPRGKTASSYTFPENETVTKIGESAFQNTTALTSINIPNGVKTIGRAAFTNSGLTEITIPDTVTNLGSDPDTDPDEDLYFDGSAFEGTSLLTKFTVAADNTHYKSIDGVLFKINDTATAASTTTSGESGTELTLLRYPGAKADLLYTIPSQDDNGHAVKVTAIQRRAFEASRYLTSVSIPDSVKTIGFRAFNASMNLVSVFLPDSVEKIGALAFQGCYVLKDVYYAGDEDEWKDLTVTDYDLNFESSDLDELRIAPPGSYESFEAMGDDFHGDWTIPLTNNVLLLGMEKDDINFKRFFSPPTFHYESDGTVKITLAPNGGTLAEGTQTSWTVPYNTASSDTPSAPSRSGYSFAGWTYTMRVFDWERGESGEYITVTRVWSWDDPVYTDMTLTASWSRNSTSYSVTLPGTVENGTIKSSHRHAEKGELVTLTVTPDKGYTLETLTITDKKGNAIELTDKGDGTFTFKMPEGEITVTVRFAPNGTMKFVDVPAGSYFYSAVLWAVENGITGGVDATHFMPYNACPRAQLVTLLWRAAGCPEPNAASSFGDIPANAYYAKAVAWAFENGIVSGYGNGLFGVNDTITRQQLVAILYRFAKAMGMDTSVGKDTNILSYNDVAQVSEYAVEAFQWAVGAGIVQGNDGNLMPTQPCTRAQIVTMLYRLLGK